MDATSTTFAVDLSMPTRPSHQPWQWAVGSGHATLALRADWQAQLAQARLDLGFRHVRFHGILDDDMGTLIMPSDPLLYSFFNTDRIFDFLLSIDMKPVVELSFMPRRLSSGNDSVFHYQGNVTPPRDLDQWGELVRRLAAHWVERYGIDEVASWPFEVWNEPNLKLFWTGDQAAYFALYDSAATALKSVDARLRVGGPVTAANGWLDDFTGHCEKAGTPLDFMSTHYYLTDAFAQADSDTVTQLEHAPRDDMLTKALEARNAAGKLPLYFTEWNISSNPRDPQRDSSVAAALAVRIVMSVDEVVDGYSWWTFTDIFEENGFPSAPFHGGFGLMNLYGVPKPIYRAFEMVRALGGERFVVEGTHPTVDVWVTRRSSSGGDSTTALVVNQAMPRHPIGNEAVSLRLAHDGARRVGSVTVERVDEDHANPARAWAVMGTPAYLKPGDVQTLLAASQVTREAVAFDSAPHSNTIDLVVAPQSVNLLRIEWEAMP